MNQIAKPSRWGDDTPPKVLATYQNGGYQVTIHEDGTKVRVGEGSPAFPESVDLKLTDYCDLGCRYCHEMSTRNGAHGAIQSILNLWDGMPRGVEIAIGGGNPLSHPMLIPYLEVCRERGHIANLTVNQLHVEEYRDLINMLLEERLVHGLGVSVRDLTTLSEDLPSIWHQDNVVLHMILGVNSYDQLAKAFSIHPKVLLLGYKTFGWGIKHKERHWGIDDVIQDWRRNAGRLFHVEGTLSFDNLAITQLELRRWFSPEAWSSFYMGDDGSFTMYVDAVKWEYAVGSTSAIRVPIGEQALTQCFAALQIPPC